MCSQDTPNALAVLCATEVQDTEGGWVSEVGSNVAGNLNRTRAAVKKR